jgi:hypothetical protein
MEKEGRKPNTVGAHNAPAALLSSKLCKIEHLSQQQQLFFFFLIGIIAILLQNE